MSETHAAKVRLSPLLRAALFSRKPGEDIDEALLRTLKAEHPEEAVWLLSAAMEAIELEIKRSGEDRERVVHHLAASEPGPEIAVRSSQLGPLHVSMRSTVYRVGGKEYHSLEELPPDLRRAVEAALPADVRAAAEASPESPPALPGPGPVSRRDDRRPVRMGCSMALLAALWRLVSR